jgi:hypothetical protein
MDESVSNVCGVSLLVNGHGSMPRRPISNRLWTSGIWIHVGANNPSNGNNRCDKECNVVVTVTIVTVIMV